VPSAKAKALAIVLIAIGAGVTVASLVFRNARQPSGSGALAVSEQDSDRTLQGGRTRAISNGLKSGVW
jgi:hypothetical protein